MSVVGCTLRTILGGRSDITGLRENGKLYVVETDNVQDGRKIVEAADYGGVRVERYGDYFRTDTESDPQCLVESIESKLVEENESKKLWHVTVFFSTAVSSGAQTPAGIIQLPQPEQVNPEYEWDWIDERRPAYVELVGPRDFPLPIVNSASDFYNPPGEYDFSMPVLRFTRNQLDFDPISAAFVANKVNADTWKGFPPHTVLIRPPKARIAVEKTIVFWKVTYELHFNLEGHYWSVWDAGLREFVSKEQADARNAAAPTGAPKVKAGFNHMKDEDGTFVTEPQLLDGKGGRLIPAGSSLSQIDMREKRPKINHFRLYRQIAFEPLGII